MTVSETARGDAGDGVLAVTLPSGLRVLARESTFAPVAEIQVWAKVGSADEAPDESGIAHFHEHMLFKGTERRGVGEIAAEIEGVGGHINAYTSFDVTVYHATVPAEAVEVAVDVLADATRHSVFAPDEVSREIDVVLEEIRRSEDTPHHVLGDALFAAAFRAHPYRRPILGSPESVRGFTSARVSSFYRRWYRPDNMMVVAVGAFDAGRLCEAVDRSFRDGGAGTAKAERAPEPAALGPRAVVLRRPFERGCLEVCWPSVRFAHPDTPLLDLLAFILGEGESSRLVRTVKERDQLADRIDASSYTPLDPGLFGASADFDPAGAAPLLSALGREIELLRCQPVTAAELDKARANFLAAEQWERESVSGQARKLGTFEFLAGDRRRERAYLDAVAGATPEKLFEVAQRWLDPERLVAAVLLPEEGTDDLGEAEVLAALADGARAARRRFRPPVPRGAERSIESFELPGGAQLHAAVRRELPLASLRFAMLGGLLADAGTAPGASHFLAGMWVRGTRSRSAAEFARQVESLAGDVDGFSGRSSIGLTVDGTRDHLEALIELAAEVLREPALSAEETERERSDTLAALERREDRLGARVFDLLTEAMYPRHPYRFPLLGRRDAMEALEVRDLEELHGQVARSGNLHIGAVGDFDPEELARLLSRELAELPEGEPGFALPEEDPPAGEVREVVLEKDRAQAHLALGFHGLRVDDPDRYAVDVLCQVLGGQGGRLFLELRDRRALAYSVAAFSAEGVAPGYFAFYIATSPEKFDDARRGLFEEIERVLEEPPASRELELARRHLIGSHAIEQQRGGARAFHMALDGRYGLGPANDQCAAERIAGVSTEDVLRVSRRLFDLDAYTLAAIRPGG